MTLTTAIVNLVETILLCKLPKLSRKDIQLGTAMNTTYTFTPDDLVARERFANPYPVYHALRSTHQSITSVFLRVPLQVSTNQSGRGAC